MECSRCGDPDPTRSEIQFESDAVVVVYLCRDCSKAAARDGDVSEIAYSVSP